MLLSTLDRLAVGQSVVLQWTWQNKSSYAAAHSEQIFVLPLSCCPAPLIRQSNSPDGAGLPSQTEA